MAAKKSAVTPKAASKQPPPKLERDEPAKPSSGLTDAIHSKGPSPCHKIAFRFSQVPHISEPVSTQYVVLLNNKRPEPGELMICGSCRRVITPNDVVPVGGWTK